MISSQIEQHHFAWQSNDENDVSTKFRVVETSLRFLMKTILMHNGTHITPTHTVCGTHTHTYIYTRARYASQYETVIAVWIDKK